MRKSDVTVIVPEDANGANEPPAGGGVLAAFRREKLIFGLTGAAIAGALLVPALAWPLVASAIAIPMLRLLWQGAAGSVAHNQQVVSEAAGAGAISAIELAAAMPEPVIIFDSAPAVAYANEAAKRAFGGLQQGMPLFLKFRAPEMQDLIASVVSGGPLRTTGYLERVPLEASYKVTGGRIGVGPDLFFLSFRDQSEVRRIDRMRADFIANASHEMRTPLASISGFVETLRGPARDDPAARERFLKIMHDQAARMSRLIDDLLSLSRLEMKSHAGPTDAVDIRQVVENVVDTLRPLSAELSVKIETVVEAADTVVSGHRDELFQVFENLVENACKYGQSGGRIVITLAPAASVSRREICVTVRDFGPGIPAEHIPRVTERFYRVDLQSSRAQKGTGLGLAIVKHILTRHEGRLVIKSEVGQGAQFSVYLPIA